MGDVIPIRRFGDSISNVAAGLGDPMRDKMAATTYGLTLLDDMQLAAIYKSNWMGRKAVDIPALDSVRKGRDWQADQDQIELIEAEEKRLDLWGKLLDALVKARLWGGAAIFIGTGDQNLMEPLNVERVGKGGVKYLTVLSRRDVTAGPIEQDVLSEFHGKPAYYEVTGQTTMVRIHPSRMAIFTGARRADPLMFAGANQGWGDSVLEAMYSAMRNADATAANIASLIFEANVDVFKIPNLSNNLADPSYQDLLIRRFTAAATLKGINRALIMDGEEEYDRKTISFATLPEILQQFMQQFCGAADIPMTRFFGTAPSGLGSNGDHSMNNYHDRINSAQTLEITPAMYRLDECLIRSALGSRPPAIYYAWAPLENMSEKEIAEIGKITAETAQIVSNAGIFTAEELRKVTTNAFVELGAFPGIDQAVADTDAAGGFDLGEGEEPNEGDEGTLPNEED